MSNVHPPPRHDRYDGDYRMTQAVEWIIAVAAAFVLAGVAWAWWSE